MLLGNRIGHQLLRADAGQNLSKTASDPTGTQHFKVFVDNVEVPPEDLPLQQAARGMEVRDYEEEVRFERRARRFTFTAAPSRCAIPAARRAGRSGRSST